MLSKELESCLNQAFHQARGARHESLTVEHLLLAILDAPRVREVLEGCGADLGRLGTELRHHVQTDTPRLLPEEQREVQPTLGFQRVLQRAVFHVQSSGNKEVGVVNVLVAIFSEKQSHAVFLLSREHVTRLDVVNYVNSGLRADKSARADAPGPTQGTQAAQEATTGPQPAAAPAHAQPPWRIGFVGVGMMGAPMARRLLQAGHELYIADTDAARVSAFTDGAGARRLEPPAAAHLDALITMLPSSQIVESALLGESGAGSEEPAVIETAWARHLPPGALVIDMSSSDPARSRQLAVTLSQLGLAYLDAPVSGGVRKAQSGSLAILVGGEAAVLERCRPLLQAMGTSVLHVGAAGAGHAAKALNNYVSAAGLVAAVEALHVAARFGIAPAVMTEVLNASTGRNNTTENKVTQFMLSGTFASGFTLQLMVKDLKIARSLAQSVGYPMRFGTSCAALWEEAGQRGTPTSDHTEMYRLLADEPADDAG